MFDGRTLFTATLLQNGQVLIVGGVTNGVPLAEVELFDPATGAWTQTGSLNTPRYGHVATELSSGKVLVLGGYSTNYLASAELYDPQTGVWTNTGSLQTSRYLATATLLQNGMVLAVGGSSVGTNTPTSELYDPAAGTWSQTGNLQDGRVEHTATLMPDGTVLVAGGIGTTPNPGDPSGLFRTLSSMESYDPDQGTWSTAGNLLQPRFGHTSTLLPNGQVLFAGGATNGFVYYPDSSAELYDPVTGTNTATAPMNAARFLHTTTLLPNNTVLALGGMTDVSSFGTATAEVYDPSTGMWSLTNGLDTPRYLDSATLLAGGQILLAGGTTNNSNVALNSTELYDPTIAPSTGTWTNTGSMQNPRADFTLTLLPNGKVLAAGGQNGNGPYSSSCELFDPVSGTWTNTGSLNLARFNHTATLLPSGKVLVVGGAGGSIGIATPELFNPNTGIWTTNGAMNSDHYANTTTLLANGKVLVAGAAGGTDVPAGSGTNSAELYDPIANTWTATGEMITPRTSHTAVLLTNGQVLVVDGRQSTTNLSSAELYDPTSGTWSAAGATRAVGGDFTAAALLPDGQVLVPGADTNGLPVADLYNPTNGSWSQTGSPYTNHFSPTLTMLPNGKALLAGDDPTPEIYDPATGQWTVTAGMNLERQSFANALLPDGRILFAGGEGTNGSPNIIGFTNAELFDVGLGFTNSRRPQITSATPTVNFGTPLTVAGSGFRGLSEGDGGKADASHTDFPLVQLRALENAQTAWLLTTNWSTNSFVSVPVTNFPMGYALATVFVSGIQSTSAIVEIGFVAPAPVPVRTLLTHLKFSTNGFQFDFTNAPGVSMSVISSTNLGSPLSNWLLLGGATETSPGQFQFIDPQAGANRRRFYQVVSP